MNLSLDSDLDFLCCLSTFISSIFKELQNMALYSVVFSILFY